MKKFFKSITLCLVVAVFAICGLAGCGKKEEEVPVEPAVDPTTVETISAQDLYDFFEDNNVWLEFVDGFSLQLSIDGIEAKQSVDVSAKVLTYYDRTDLQASVQASVESKYKVSTDIIWKDSDDNNDENDHVYVNFDYSSKGWVDPSASDVDLDKIDINKVVGNIVEMVKDLPAINTYPSRALYLASDMNEEIVVEKITIGETGEVEYRVSFDNGQYYLFGFNQFNELAKFDAFVEAEIEGEAAYVEVKMGALYHNDRIFYPENIDEYIEITA